MFAFNVNNPTSLDAIEQYIGGYATPEAAESDTRFNAPRGLDYLTNQYQALTGDAFADPFQDASRARTRSLTEAAMNGASVATGSNMGGKLLSFPEPPATQPAGLGTVGPVVPPMNVEGTPLSSFAKRDTSNSLLTSMLQSKGNQYQMSGSRLQVPNPSANDYLSVLSERASRSGAQDLFTKIYQNNPGVFDKGVGADDPRFARVQGGGKEGKVDAADALHPIAYDPHFMEAARRDPTKAKALYSAVTNGRDYGTDIEAKSQLLGEQRDARKKLIEGIKNVEADPVTGDLYKLVETKDLAGNITQQRVPLNPMDKSAIEAEGGFKRIYGIDLPNRAGLAPLPGMTQDEHAQYRSRTQQLMKTDPNLSVQAASKLAHRQLYQEQQSKVATLQPSDTRPGIIKAKDTLARFMMQGTNAAPIALINDIMEGANKSVYDLPRMMGMNLPHAPHIPNIPVPTDQQFAEAYSNEPAIADIWKEGNQYWNERLPVAASR